MPKSMPFLYFPSMFSGLRKVMRSDDKLFPASHVVDNDLQLAIEVNDDYVNEIMSRLDEALILFSFLTCSSVASLHYCATFYVIRDKSLFVGSLRE